MKCLKNANLADQGFYHIERFFALANKLLNTANQTMQTVLKYRSKGQQTVQVVHVHNEGQAIVTQNLSPLQGKGRPQKKSQIEPHGSLWRNVQQKVKDLNNSASNGQSAGATHAICMVDALGAQQLKLGKSDRAKLPCDMVHIPKKVLRSIKRLLL